MSSPTPQRSSSQFISLRIKFLFGLTLVCGVVFSGVYCWFYNYATQKAMNRVQEDMVNTLNGAIAGVNGDEFAVLAEAEVPPNQTVPVNNPLYQKHQHWLMDIHRIEPRANPYSVVKGDQLYEVLWVGDSLRVLQPNNATAFRESYLADPANTRLYQGFDGLTLTLTPYTDQWGSWISAYGPIKNSKGQVVGLLGVDFQANYVRDLQQGFQKTLAIAFLVTYVFVMLVVYVLARFLTKPVMELTQAAELISEGIYDQTLTAFQKGRFVDEISLLAKSFDRMTAEVKQRESDLEGYSHTLEQQVQQRTQELQEKNLRLIKTLEELKATQTQLIQTEKMSSLGQLVAGIAHEINNPLNFIQCNLIHAQDYMRSLIELLQVYQRHCPTEHPEIVEKAEEVSLPFIQEDLPNLIRSMESGTVRIGDIVRSLRVFSRLDEADVKQVDIHEGLDSTLLLLTSRLRGTVSRPEIEVVRNYAELPLVECYAGQLNQVFMNILSNAIESLEAETVQWKPVMDFAYATSAAGSSVPSSIQGWETNPRIQISTQQVDGQRIQIRIIDNGPGMPEAVKPRIFDPFFTTKPVGQGTGLGLSICLHIVKEKHGGEMQCISAPGKGAEFVIEIPLRQND